jgi:hypothetical protein
VYTRSQADSDIDRAFRQRVGTLKQKSFFLRHPNRPIQTQFMILAFKIGKRMFRIFGRWNPIPRVQARALIFQSQAAKRFPQSAAQVPFRGDASAGKDNSSD